ncbi:MAG: lipopolysaccharide biosynthesis protein [Clostridia bacterium]|nr:lipopolysaccharide biosynthesis protein [Clostridia bacterium]
MDEEKRKEGIDEEVNAKANMKDKVLSGAFWVFLEKGGLSIAEFIVAWVLARFFLTPADYSTVGLISIFINFSNVFVQGGFNNALIQKKKLEDDDCSTVFWLSLGLSCVFYIGLFFGAPFIASYYARPILKMVLRIQSLSLILGALCVVQTAILTRQMEFKKIFLRTCLSTVLSAVLGIGAAFLGFGVWTIVIQMLTVSVVNLFVMWFSVKWRPRFRFSIKRLKELFGFGSNMLASNVISFAHSNTLPVVMDKLYAPSTLGYYNKSRTIPTKVGDAINSTVSNVVFPSLSKYQSEPEKVKEMTRRFIVTASFLMFAIMGGLIAVAKPLILFMYTDKWANSIIMMQFVCVSYAFMPLNSANLQAIKALGRGDIYLRLEIIKDVIGIVLLGVAIFLTRDMEHGLYIVLAVQAFVSLLSVAINAFPNKKLMNYSFLEQLKDILPSLLLAVIMCGAVYSVSFLGLSDLLTLVIQLPLGVLIYCGFAYILKFECFRYIINTAKGFIVKKFNLRKGDNK